MGAEVSYIAVIAGGKMLYDQWDILYSVSLCMAGICMGKNAF